MDEQENKDKERAAKAKKAVASYMLFELGAEFAVILALPILGAVYGGEWLNAKYDSKLFVALLIPVAIAMSSYLIYKKIKEAQSLMK